MTGKEEVFLMLREHRGEFVSGEELAGKIHISRNAVWKAVEVLRKEGHIIDAVTRKGYCLVASAGEVKPNLCINKEEILAAFTSRDFVKDVVVLEQTESTNRVAKKLAMQGAPEGTLVTAICQSEGKGRLGRQFFSPTGGIYMSMILRPKLSMERAVLLTTAAAVSVARAIEKVVGIDAGIKWVNDIYISGKKVCGILTEASIDFESGLPEYVVIGIGINVEVNQLPEELTPIVGFLNAYAAQPINKNYLIAAVWDAFAEIYPVLSEAEYMEEYRRRSILIGKTVTVLDVGESYPAVVKDIDREGHLLVEANGELHELSTGEVSIRLNE